ncbi:DUF2878 domain-containing protein [Pandoraea apista]|uniref:DUF2878 domain-containing protein n=1 Tax=Pandoraea apista TaxID=93218 RepID=UPI0021AD88A1|nr:DUF2878 domain-containing protein [Pandoraea apista]
MLSKSTRYSRRCARIGYWPHYSAQWGGPLSFRAGAALGAVTFTSPWAALTVIAIGWAVHFPVLLWLGGRVGSAPMWRPAAQSGGACAKKSKGKLR